MLVLILGIFAFCGYIIHQLYKDQIKMDFAVLIIYALMAFMVLILTVKFMSIP